jgi:hypothetical protein
MRDELADSDRVLAGLTELRPVMGDGVVEREPTRIDQQQQAAGGQALRPGEDDLQGVAGPRQPCLAIGAPSPEVHDLALPDLGRERGPVLAVTHEVVSEGVGDVLEATVDVAVDRQCGRWLHGPAHPLIAPPSWKPPRKKRPMAR